MPARIPHSCRFAICLVAVCSGAIALAGALTAAEKNAAPKSASPLADKPLAANPLFEKDVLPVFKAKCVSCHNSKARKAELDLSSLAAILKGSESGAVLVAHKPDESLLFEMIHANAMPPEGQPQLTAAEKQLIHRWIQTGAPAETETAPTEEISQHDIVPLMYLRCTVCHGLREQQGGLDLRSKAAMLRGGKSGPAIVPGKPEASLALQRIHAEEMPPRKQLIVSGARPMEPAEVELFTKWIAAGAPEIELSPDIATTEPDPLVTDKDREFWSFRPAVRPAVPQVRHADRVRNPIDAFLLARLEEQGLSYSAEADRLALVRRVAFDLTGLPPRWEQVEEFLADTSPQAYENMVDRFLASQHYGERWGQYWLDLSGYADSEGKRSADPIRPHAWRYRDYVIRSLNADKPYDRFLLEQIAGDELADYESAEVITAEMADNLIATGFLRMAPDGTGSDVVNTVAERMEVISDEINVLGSAVLGLTLKCAQCHTHKYDPIPHRDYYRLLAVFAGAYDLYDWLKPSIVPGQAADTKPGRVLPFVTTEERTSYAAEKLEVEQQIRQLEQQLKSETDRLAVAETQKRLAELPAEIRADVQSAISAAANKRNEVQQYLASRFEQRLHVDAVQLRKLNPELAKFAETTEKKIAALKAKMPDEPQIRALWDRGDPSPTYIFRRGEFTNPGRLVGPGVPSVLTDGRTPFDVQPPWPGAQKTGRRLAFARWLVAPDHPLTARVMVNRIWHHHFGRGIVKSLDDFGKTGTPPTHPELLDWLAREFVEQGWSVKQLHRLMLNSAAYRQVSRLTSRLEQADPENSLVSRMPLGRMQAESLFDSTLAIAGKLVDRPFGSPDPVEVRADGLVTPKAMGDGWRRAIYVMHRRKEMPTILETFDMPQMIPNCIERPDSTVASQALHMMNDGMIRQLSHDFARRIERDAGREPYQQIERVYQVALSRLPSDAERELGLQALEQLQARWMKELGETATAEQAAAKALENYCHTIMNSAAFTYID